MTTPLRVLSPSRSSSAHSNVQRERPTLPRRNSTVRHQPPPRITISGYRRTAIPRKLTSAPWPPSAGKWGKLIAQEARSDPDPASNPRLKDVVAQAKAAQVPADIIDRNLKKGSESKADYQEMLYEAYGIGGTGFIIEALTDNVNRTAAEVRTAVTKAGGKMADSGSVLFNFSRTGLVMVDAEEDEDVVFDAAIDAGATDVQREEDGGENEGYRVLTSLEDYAAVQKKLVEAGLKINAETSGLVYVPLVVKGEDEVTDEDYEANETILEKLLDVDDVDAVFKNY